MRRWLLVAILFTPTSVWAQEDVETRAREITNKLANVQHNWGPKMSTPGASISLQEIGRGEMDGHAFVDYKLFANGLPGDLHYQIVSLPIDLRPHQLLDDVTLDKKGEAHCNAPKPNDELDLKLGGADGEPMRLGLVSEDGGHKALISVIPFPIRGTDKSCSVEAVRLMPNNELVLIEGAHFPPNTEVQMISSSENEEVNGKKESDEHGNLEFALMTGVKGRDRGRTSLTLKSPACAPSIKFEWGKDTYHLH